MIRVDVDMARLERSLRSAASRFGESSKQAVIRWGVQTAREMAVETQAWGKTGTKKKQENAIAIGARSVFHIIDTRRQRRRATRRRSELVDPAEINAWIDENQNPSTGRTRRLSNEERKSVTEANLKKALRTRFKRAGMAKGAWLGAGQDIARAQTGQGRINIGRNFLGYTQTHARFGSAKRPRNPFRPITDLENKVRHAGSRDVVSQTAKAKATRFGLTKTIQWYRKAERTALDGA